MAASIPGKGLVHFLKRSWNEYPEVVGAMIMGLIGIGMGSFALYIKRNDRPDLKKFRYNYVIYRDDDPKVEELRKYRKLDL